MNALHWAGGWTSPRRGTDFLPARMWLDDTAATTAIRLGFAALTA